MYLYSSVSVCHKKRVFLAVKLLKNVSVVSINNFCKYF